MLSIWLTGVTENVMTKHIRQLNSTIITEHTEKKKKSDVAERSNQMSESVHYQQLL